MASSSSATPVSPTPQPGPGERSETTEAAPAASTKAVVNTSAVRFSARGKATPVAPSPFSDDFGDPREGFVFPLMDPWYESSPLFPLGLLISLFLQKIGIGQCRGQRSRWTKLRFQALIKFLSC